MLDNLGVEYRVNKTNMYSYFFAGRFLRLNASALPFLVGVEPENVFFLAFVDGRVASLPIRIYNRVVSFAVYGLSNSDYVVPERIGGSTVIEVKLPGDMPADLPVNLTARRYGLIRCVEMEIKTADLSLSISMGVAVAKTSYNYRVFSDMYGSADVRDEFYTWGLVRVAGVLERGVEMGVVGRGEEPMYLERYAEEPVTVERISLRGVWGEPQLKGYPQVLEFIGNPGAVWGTPKRIWSWRLSHGKYGMISYRIRHGDRRFYHVEVDGSLILEFRSRSTVATDHTALIHIYAAFINDGGHPTPLERPSRSIPRSHGSTLIPM